VIDVVDPARNHLARRRPGAPLVLVERGDGVEIEGHGQPREYGVDAGVLAPERDHGRLWSAGLAWPLTDHGAGSGTGVSSSSTAAGSPQRSGRVRTPAGSRRRALAIASARLAASVRSGGSAATQPRSRNS